MRIYVSYVGEYEGELTQDYRMQVYENELVFCLNEDKSDLEQEYGLYFVDASETLFEIFLKNRVNIPGLDLQFADILSLRDVNKILFYNRFDLWLKEIEVIFDCLYEYGVENYRECCDTYCELLSVMSKMKY